MSEDFTTEPTDKELNFKALEAENKELKASNQALLAEVSPFRAAKVIREAGFDPDTDKGKVLADLLGPDDGLEKVNELAARYNWSPAAPLTPTEQVMAESAAATNEARNVSSPDEPPNLNDEIAAAEAEGNFALSAQLKLQQFAASMPD